MRRYRRRKILIALTVLTQGWLVQIGGCLPAGDAPWEQFVHDFVLNGTAAYLL